MPRPPTPNPGLLCGVTVKNGENAGEPCQLRAGFGTRHVGFGPCQKHGGTQRAVTAKWEAELAKWEAMRFLGTYGANNPRVVDPLTALKEELYRAAGVVAWLESQVEQLAAEDVTHLTVVFEADGKPATHGEHTNEYVKLLQQERRILLDVIKVCLSFGIAQQEIAIAKEQAAVFNATLRAILVETGVDVTKPEVIAVVRKHITAAAVANVA